MVSSTVHVICSKCIKHAQTLEHFSFRPNKLSVEIQRKHTEQTKEKHKTNSVYEAFSKNRHSRSLTFDLFTLSNSPRPPLAGLYTTCIYKQYKVWTAVCRRSLPVCRTDRFYRYYDDHPHCST